MKIITIVWLVLAALLVVLHRAAHYWLGYYETPTVFAVTDGFFGIMAEFALFLLLLVPAVITDLRKKGRFWSVIGLVAFWPVVLATWFLVHALAPSEGELTARGLRDRVMHDFKPDDLHHFAKDADATGLLSDQDLFNNGDTTGFTRDQRAALLDLDQKYAFMHWMNDGDQWYGPSVTNYAQAGVIDFEWGDGKRGRWGCSVSLNSGRNDPPQGIPGQLVRVSDDIYFYYRP